MREWYSVTEMAEKTMIPHQTLRRYMANHTHLLKMKKVHKAYQINEECIDVFIKMRELYSDGRTIEQVDAELASTGLTVTIDVPNENGENINVNVASLLAHIQETVSEQGKHIQALTDALREQTEQSEKHQKYIQESLEKRDMLLMQTIRETQEAKQLMVATTEKETSQTFLERLRSLFKSN